MIVASSSTPAAETDPAASPTAPAPIAWKTGREAAAIERKIDALIGKMTIDEKVGQLHLSGLAEENIQARCRGMTLMSLSNLDGHLVLATLQLSSSDAAGAEREVDRALLALDPGRRTKAAALAEAVTA